MVEIVIGLAPNLILLLRDVGYTVTLTDGTAEGQSRGIHLDYDVIHEVFTCLVSDIAILWQVCGKYVSLYKPFGLVSFYINHVTKRFC